MSIKCCLIARSARHALAVILLLPLVSIASRTACADAGPDPIAAMVAKVSPAVVRVITVRLSKPTTDNSGPKSMADASSPLTNTATGSGFIIDPSGYIATNKHVVDGAYSVFVVTADSVRYPATIAGLAGKADIALLKIEATHDLPFVSFGDSDAMRPGERVVAIGSPFGFDTSVTSGVVSAVNRNIMESPFDDYIQTDAAINHGNSGGPLFNLSGQVIGMTSVIFSPDPASAGVGFALPSNSLHFVYDRLMTTGEVRAGMLPLHTQQVTWMLQQALDAPDLRGALVTSVRDKGDRMLQGKIMTGDIIRTFNGEEVLDPRDLARKAVRSPIGSDAALEIFRNGALETVHVTVQAWPEEKPASVNDGGPRTLGLQLASGQAANGEPTVMVAAVDPAGSAAASRIQKGDRIIEVQQTAISNPDEALQIFSARSATNHHFVAVLLERDQKLMWMSLAVPE